MRYQKLTRAEIEASWNEHWGGFVVSRGHVIRPDEIEGMALLDDAGKPLALATFAVRGDEAEVVALDALVDGRGNGRTLLAAVAGELRKRGMRRVWLVTTNDNVVAIHVYLTAGWRLKAVHLDALTESRRLKPSIPEVAGNGLPLRDELEFELVFQPGRNEG